jgi:membrane-bound metal-dependent hydrolase YbcI (DUF457 family)
MPSPIAHLTAGYAIYHLYKNKLPKSTYHFWQLPFQWLLIAGLSLLPDLDFLFGLVFGDIEKYHNNFSHSLLFGFLIALIFSSSAYWVYRSHFLMLFMVSLMSYDFHIIMDIFTGERGVMLFWPIVQDRFSSPVKLFIGVQWGEGLISIWHLWTILSELIFFLIVFIGLNFFDKGKTTARKAIVE